MVITHKLERCLNNVLQKVLNCDHGWELQIIYISCALDTIICIIMPVKNTKKQVLTWLPSFCQKTAGCGFPLVSHGKVAVRPCATIWSRGLITNWGGAGLRTGDISVINHINEQTDTQRTPIGGTSGIRRHRLPGSPRHTSMHQPVSDSIRQPWVICLLRPQTARGHGQQPQGAIHPDRAKMGGTEWMTGRFRARPCCGKGGSFQLGHI